MDGDQWRQFFDSYKREAFRLETLPVYTMPDEQEEFATFLEAGKAEVPGDDDLWLARVRRFRESGRWIGRVHIVTRPLTDYLRFEFEYYPYSVGAGEEVRILDLTGKENPGLPDQDFWMFDDTHVVEMRYRSDGTQICRELLENPDLELYVRWKRLAMDLSVPFEKYRAD